MARSRTIASTGLVDYDAEYENSLHFSDHFSRFTASLVRDLVTRYDLDGVHVDDYFYPYPERNQPFPDDLSFASHAQRGQTREEWRRANIDRFVERMWREVKASSRGFAWASRPLASGAPASRPACRASTPSRTSRPMLASGSARAGATT